MSNINKYWNELIIQENHEYLEYSVIHWMKTMTFVDPIDETRADGNSLKAQISPQHH